MNNDLQPQIKTAEQFAQEIDIPTPAATDTPIPEPAPAPTSGGSSVPPPPEPQPIFKEEPPAPDIEKPVSKEEAEEHAGMLAVTTVEGWNFLQAKGLVMYSLDDDSTEYEFNHGQKEILVKALMPYARRMGGKIPKWLLEMGHLVGAAVIVQGPMIELARAHRKVNKQNEATKSAPGFQEQVRQAAASTAKKERTNWKIDKEGYFERDLFGGYIAKVDRTEKATLDKVVQLVESNDMTIVKKAFKIDDNYLREAGVPGVG